MPLDNNDIQQIITILQRGLTPDRPIPKKRGRPSTKKTVKKTAKKSPKVSSSSKSPKPPKKSTNLFDSMGDRNMFRGDVAIDKKLNKNPPSPRTRELNIIEVKCRSCGEKEKVSSDFVLDKTRYKCNKCSMSAG